MTAASDATTSRDELGRKPWWVYALLGVVFVAASFFIFGHLVAATIASALLLGAALLVGGIIEIVHAFYTKGWGGFLLNLLIGVVYALGGAVVLYDPLGATIILTLVFAAILLASGVFRVVLAFRYWRRLGWVLLLSGIIGILAGLVIISGWPLSGLWVMGLCLGIDLLFYGMWWISYGFTARKAA